MISFVSSQHDVDATSFYCIIDFDSVSRILLLLNLVCVPALQVFMSVGSVATELAETGTKTCHVDAAGTLSSKTRSHVIQRHPESYERLLARIANTYIKSRNLINTVQNTVAGQTAVEVPAADPVECADVATSLGNPSEDGIVTVTMKKVVVIGQ